MIDYRFLIDEAAIKQIKSSERFRLLRISGLLLYIPALLSLFLPLYVWWLAVFVAIYLVCGLRQIARTTYDKGWQRGGVSDDGTFFLEEEVETVSIPYAEIAFYYCKNNILIIQGTSEAAHNRLVFIREGFQSPAQFKAVLNVLEKGIAGHKGLGENVTIIQLIRRYLAGG